MLEQEVIADDGALFHYKKGRVLELGRPWAPLADTHGHLTAFRRTDPSVAIARAALAGVRMLVVPVDPADDVPDACAFLSWFDETISRAEDLLARLRTCGIEPPSFAGVGPLTDNVRFVCGVHPYGAQRYRDDGTIRARLEALASMRRCVGIGEIGIDLGPWASLGVDVQVEAFRDQLALARTLGMPVELHLRDGEEGTLAHELAVQVLREDGVPEAGCDLHCFTSGPDVVEPFVELGCHVAFGGASTFPKNEAIREAVTHVPAHLLLSETDSPYMAPHPLRGQECEPAMVAVTVARLAVLRRETLGVPEACTYQTLWDNARSFFARGWNR